MESNARGRSAWTQAVAAQIRAERAAQGMTQRQVIDVSGLPKSTYLRMESGERVADADQLAKFAAAVGIRLSVFFQRVEERLAAAGPVDPVTAELEAGLTARNRRILEEQRREHGVPGDVADPSGRTRADVDDGILLGRSA